jgi:secondary thiamine-phosphate synthase enzyme
MNVITKNIGVRSRGEDDIIDITEETSKAVKEEKIKDGVVILFISGSTAAITTIEYEPGLLYDFPAMLSRLAPRNIAYQHDNTWHDGNGHSHVRASLLGPSLAVPFKDRNLLLGRWQQIVVVEMDTRQRERKIVLQMLGD